MAQLGKAVGILLKYYEIEHAYYEDLRAFNAPSECYDDMRKGEEARFRPFRRHACHVAGVKNLRLLRKRVRAALSNDAPIYRRYGVVPY